MYIHTYLKSAQRHCWLFPDTVFQDVLGLLYISLGSAESSLDILVCLPVRAWSKGSGDTQVTEPQLPTPLMLPWAMQNPQGRTLSGMLGINTALATIQLTHATPPSSPTALCCFSSPPCPTPSIPPWHAGQRRATGSLAEQGTGEPHRAAQQTARLERRQRLLHPQLPRPCHSGLGQELPDYPCRQP